MRMLLNHVTGCTGFEDIRTLSDGTICSAFKEAACMRGLLEDDNEYDLCLAEAATCSSPPQLRQLFVTILIFNTPSNPVALWEKYKTYFCEDFCIRAQKSLNNLNCDQYALNKALIDIENHLLTHGMSLSKFPGMPLPSYTSSPFEEALVIQHELDYDINEQQEIVNTNFSFCQILYTINWIRL